MRVLYERCCGLDVHKETVVACLRVQGRSGKAGKTVRTFRTTTPSLLALSDWLLEAGCTHVALESTGVYWKPIFNILEGTFEVILVNARHIKAVPGRKSDVKDCEWIADLLAHGLVHGSFIPPAPIRQLRELTRYRKALIRERATEVNRIHKLLEGANIKLASVATDVLGVSGRAMLKALVRGERDAEELTRLAKGLLRKKAPELTEALTGRFDDHHAFILGRILSHLEFLEQSIAECDQRIQELASPFERQIELLATAPGVRRRTAEVLVAELGVDMSRFPNAAHLASWAKICPNNRESAGKRMSAHTGRGNNWLKTALLEAAWAASRTRNTYLSALYRRVARHSGRKRAAVAVAHSLLVAVFHMLRDNLPYSDLGPDHFDHLNTQRLVRYYLRRLEQLGHPLPPPAGLAA
jgi:transposase